MRDVHQLVGETLKDAGQNGRRDWGKDSLHGYVADLGAHSKNP